MHIDARARKNATAPVPPRATPLMRSVIVTAAVLALTGVLAGRAARADCPGDLDGDQTVSVDEIVRIVGAALTGCTAPGGAAADTCPGDLNGDGAVTINEIVTAVNSGLNGCRPTPTPTPTFGVTATPTPTIDVASDGCPETFVDRFPVGVACGYSGAFSSRADCPNDLDGLLASDGTLVGVGLGSDPIVTLGAEVTSPATATLVAYLVGDDPTPHAISGTLELQDGGRTLIIDPTTELPFDIGAAQCRFDRYTGAFTQLFSRQPVRAAALSPADLGSVRWFVSSDEPLRKAPWLSSF